MINPFSSKYSEILGINQRNQEFIRGKNSAAAKRIADNKLLSKKVLAGHDIQTPDLYKVIRSPKQIAYIDWASLPKSFVIKPNRGSIGSGILVFYGKDKKKDEWIRPNGQKMGIPELEAHIGKILEGRFSMGSKKDVVIIEERIKTDKYLKKFSYKGVPDIRIIVYNNVPVMAMLRLPTKRSDGKANLHAGGICAGIDIASGLTTTAMQLRKKGLIEDTYESVEFTQDLPVNYPVQGIKIPYWDKILEMSIRSQKVTDLGYMGVDIVIDSDKGPMILELNARPGLGIQSANEAGLLPRLKRVEGLKVRNVKHGIELAKNLFGGEIEETIESVSGKQVVNLVEKVDIYYQKAKKLRKEVVSAFLDTGVLSSRIDRGLASRTGFSNAITFFTKLEVPKSFQTFSDAKAYLKENLEELELHQDIVDLRIIPENQVYRIRPVIEIKLRIAGTRKSIEMIVSNQSEMLYPILIGRKDLKEYLIDPSKTFSQYI